MYDVESYGCPLNPPSVTLALPTRVFVEPLEKKEEQQQMHMIRANENKPILPPVGESATFLSRTNEISPSS